MANNWDVRMLYNLMLYISLLYILTYQIQFIFNKLLKANDFRALYCYNVKYYIK